MHKHKLFVRGFVIAAHSVASLLLHLRCLRDLLIFGELNLLHVHRYDALPASRSEDL
jgi:hypothetical protein